MRLSLLPSLLLSFLLFFLLLIPTFAAKKSYIVYLGGHSHGPEPTSVELNRVTEAHYDFLGSFLGSNEKAKEAMFYSYNKNINGFAAILEEKEALEIAKHPNVLSVFLNKEKKLHTTRSWDFLNLEKNGVIQTDSIWEKARLGEDTIIGNLDTGVWPESKSFSDEGMGPVPTKWRGKCKDETKNPVTCNRKLIGARYFNKGYRLNSTFNSARDYDGHGSHTLSTAGGNLVHGANVFGYGNGTAKGGSPGARVAAYKVCWPQGGCPESDILAAFDAAIQDGVDVISVSVGGDADDYFTDSIAIGSFHAVKKGIVVVSSAGNEGPQDATVQNVAPWMITVGASTIDREFTTYVALGNKKHLKGTSLSSKGLPSHKFYPLISAADAKATHATAEDAILCKPKTLNPKKVKGKILVCLRGENARVEKGQQAALAGAVGFILANDMKSGNELIADAHVLAASHINFSDGVALFSYLNSTKNPMAFLTRVKTQLGTKPAPFMASFSSRGPNTITPEILKPDITAPGVNIIAAYSESIGPTDLKFDKRRTPFNAKTGTSMSCPHISGIAGLLKTLHPDWSPAAIKSAIMTTARTRDNNKVPMLNSSNIKSTPFSYGAGHVRPNRAMDPGLVYDSTVDDYLDFLCAIGYNRTQLKIFSKKPYKCPKSFALTDFNYPSITVPELSGSLAVSRTLKNVGAPGTYTARVQAPPGISVAVKPKKLVFREHGEEQRFSLRLKAQGRSVAKDYVFGRLIWSDGRHYVRSPIVVKAHDSA